MSKEERLRDVLDDLPAWMPKDESNNENLLLPAVEELEKISGDIESADLASTVQTASEDQLRKLSPLVEINQHDNEPLEVFRSRVLVGFLANVSSGTLPDLYEAVSIVLDIDKSRVDIVEWYTYGRSATITIDVPDGALSDRSLTDQQFIDIIDRIVAAGVGLGLENEINVTETLVVKDEADPQVDDAGVFYWNVAEWEVDYYG